MTKEELTHFDEIQLLYVIKKKNNSQKTRNENYNNKIENVSPKPTANITLAAGRPRASPEAREGPNPGKFSPVARKQNNRHT